MSIFKGIVYKKSTSSYLILTLKFLIIETIEDLWTLYKL